ncbi:MAG: oligosaccharide flippase family protein [candidate division Zixibacteria bacterium]|nr:oligosaccharide flippase family protein [candidate division Zixibacteria bacterium]
MNSVINPKKQLPKNIFSNWVGSGVAAAIGFFMSPFLVHTLGKDSYGIWVLVSSVVAYSNFFDAGMKQSLAKYLPKYYANGDYDNLNKVINSSLFIYVIVGTITVIFTFVLSFYFTDLFEVPASLFESVKMTVIFVGLSQACIFIFMPISALGPFHRYDIVNGFGIIRSILVAFLFYILLTNGYGIQSMALVTLTIGVITLSGKRIVQQKLIPQIKLNLKYIDRSQIRALMNYGSISFFIVISWLIIFNTANTIIGIFISSSAVAIYSIAGLVINYLRVIISSIGVPLVPTISHLESNADYDEIRGLYGKLSNYLFYLTSCMCVGILFFIDDFINLWMGPGFEQTIEIVYILIIPASIYLPQVMANSILLGLNRHKLLLKILFAEAISNIALSLILIQKWGIYGVAFGTVIPQLIIYICFYPVLFNKVIKAKVKTFYISNVRVILIGCFATIPVAFIAKNFIQIDGWLGLICKVAIVCVLIVGFFLYKIADDDDRGRLLSILTSDRKKK